MLPQQGVGCAEEDHVLVEVLRPLQVVAAEPERVIPLEEVVARLAADAVPMWPWSAIAEAGRVDAGDGWG